MIDLSFALDDATTIQSIIPHDGNYQTPSYDTAGSGEDYRVRVGMVSSGKSMNVLSGSNFIFPNVSERKLNSIRFTFIGGMGFTPLTIDTQGNSIDLGVISNWYFITDHYERYMLCASIQCTYNTGDSGLRFWANSYFVKFIAGGATSLFYSGTNAEITSIFSNTTSALERYQMDFTIMKFGTKYLYNGKFSLDNTEVYSIRSQNNSSLYTPLSKMLTDGFKPAFVNTSYNNQYSYFGLRRLIFS